MLVDKEDIPKFGSSGAAIATVIAEFLFVVMYYRFIVKHKIVKFKMRDLLLIPYITPIISSVFMTVIIINIPDLLIGIIVGAVSYIGMLFILKTFKKEDKDLWIRVKENI